MKIAVMGYSGAGKSTLAKKLGRLYDCPVLYLEGYNLSPDGKRGTGKKQSVWQRNF